MLSPPWAMRSAGAVLPEPRAPMIATIPGLMGKPFDSSQGRLGVVTDFTLYGVPASGGVGPMLTRPRGSKQAALEPRRWDHP